LAFLSFSTSAASTIRQEESALSIHLPLPPPPTSIEATTVEAVVEAIVVAVVEAVVETIVVASIQCIANCRSEDSGAEGSQADPHQTAVKSLIACEETGIDI